MILRNWKTTELLDLPVIWRACFLTSVFIVSQFGWQPGMYGQEPGVAFVTLGDSKTPRHVGSVEISLEPMGRKNTSPVITALASSPDGAILAAAGDDHGIRLVDVTTGNTVQTIAGHSDWIQALTFSSDGQYLYSAGNDGRVMRWNRSRPVETEQIIQLPFAVRSISVTTEKQLLAIGGFSQEIVVWNTANQVIQYRLHCDCKDQRCVQFSPDGTQLLCGGRDGSVRVWRSDDGQEIASFREHRGEVHTAAFSSDGNMVTSVGNDRQLIRYDLQAGQLRLKREISASKLTSMCLINDGLVAVAGADNSVHLYDVVADEVVAHLKGHFGTVAVMSPCGKFLASGSFDTSIRIWDLASIDAQQIEYGKPVHAPLNMDNKLRIR